MGLPKRLTEMQKRFAELLVFGGPDGPLTKTEAAKLAGYSEKRCRQEGSELTNPKLNPLVAKYLGELREERLKKNSFSAAVNAETNRGKAAGLYIDRKIIKTGKLLEDLSEVELEQKMKKILDDYSQIIDVTPDKDQEQLSLDKSDSPLTNHK